MGKANSALTIIALLAVLASACKGEAPAPPPLTASDIVTKSSERMEQVNSFHFELDHVGGGTPIALGLEMSKAIGDVTRPGKLQARLSATTVSMFIEVEVVTVGQTTYMTHPLTGNWESLPSEFSAVGLFNPDIGIIAIMRGIGNLARLDDETVAGIRCYHIKGSIDSDDLRPMTGGSAVEGVIIGAEVWVGGEDFLVRQIRLEGRVTETEAPGITRTLKLSRFDQPVTIELPK